MMNTSEQVNRCDVQVTSSPVLVGDAGRSRRNLYTCASNLHLIVTVDRDEGTTPMMILCPHCGDWARSSFYQIPLFAAGIEPEYEWRKPTEHELRECSHDMLEYYRLGGLKKLPLTSAK